MQSSGTLHLVEAARLIRQAGYAQHLVVDALVLLRLDAQLTDEAAGMVGELGAFLGLDAAALAAQADDAADILGLDTDDDDDDEEEDDGTEDDDGYGGSVLAEFWPGRLDQPLTAAALRGGLQGGLWLLDADLAVDFPWHADNAALVFHNGATLKTVAEQGAITLTACRLVDATLVFEGECSIALTGCDWQGDYDPADRWERMALRSTNCALTVTDCRFATRHTSAIAVQDAALTLTASRFTQCGNAKAGGAVMHVAEEERPTRLQRTIDGCHFERCLALVGGGAILVDSLYGVRHCEFSACASVALQNQQAGDIAVCAYEARGNPAVSDCVFRQTSLSIGNAGYSNNLTFVRSTQFQQGNVYYHNKGSKNTITRGCSFARGREIEREFTWDTLE